MTRLTSCDIKSLFGHMPDFDKKLLHLTGMDMLGIACHCAGISRSIILKRIKHIKAAAITMTPGQGEITQFSRTIADILAHMGFNIFIPDHTDVAGFAQAIENRVDIIFMADDHRYIAFNPTKYCKVDNSIATGKVFAAALDLMAAGIRGKKALVIGCGPVGSQAAQTLMNFGAHVGIHDMDYAKCKIFCKGIEKKNPGKIEFIPDMQSINTDYPFILEATSGKDVIHNAMIGPDTCISAPGVPLGVSMDSIKKAGSRILYDPLQLGTAAMAVMAVLGDEKI